MSNFSSSLKYILLYLPWLLSLLFLSDPIVSYLVAWFGSFYIFYISFTNKVKETSPGQPLTEKILRPLFLMQIIFAGYMSCTSIFYFLDNLGYEYATKILYKSVNKEQILYIASCQRDYVLGHAALVHGLLLFYKDDNEGKYLTSSLNWPLLFIKIAIICFPLSILFNKISGLSQFSEQAEGLSFVAATLALAISIPQRKISITLLAGALFAMNLSKAFLSGMKEPVIVSVLMLGIFLYPFYKRTVTFFFIPILFFLFMVLPTYVGTIRQMNWNGKASAEAAQKEALSKVQKEMSGENISKTNWDFLTGRLSEMDMFIKYKRSLEKRKVFYELQIPEQALILIIPRIFWPSKPIPEKVAMERVYENGIIERISVNSAKPAVVVDGYLSGGTFGVWITLFIYGVIAQVINNKAEELFGGYFLGTVLVFTGLFRIFWRGNCFEFLFNSIFWSYISMYMLFLLFKRFKIIYEVKQGNKDEETSTIMLTNSIG